MQKAWMMEGEGRSKLGMLKKEDGCGARCVQVAWKELRQIMAKLRGGTVELMVETGRWIGLKREDRICGRCGLMEVENVDHFVLRCDGLVREKEVLMERMTEVKPGLRSKVKKRR